ncbi:hypothetical protein PACTADRAFT_644 [Pachysolen tannophilus NRRL Y-2460]|uniref:Helicase C-terminal domain-containing protein n=1 Tax=Pachysolen tannophilus NRRL Y-2460 TaxID=669874 RepID=A0A1E4U2E1_PACTA|nr:hypothetical protein PACTADRAFT_644 [Pachysolen tannophilus NRRL Y-2460]
MSSTSSVKLFQKVSAITNNLPNLEPLGTLFLKNLPRLPSNGIEVSSDDDWRWFDPPANENTILRSINCDSKNDQFTFADLLIDLKYLSDRCYIKITYKHLANNFAILRIYTVPFDVTGHHYISEYRDLYRRGKSILWHAGRFKAVLSNLLMILDYSRESWIGKFEKPREKTKNLLIFDCLKPWEEFHSNKIGMKKYFNEEFGNQQDIFNYHITRLINRKPYSKYDSNFNDISNSDCNTEDLEARLLKLYNDIKSPDFSYLDSHTIKKDQRELILEVLNNEIPGFKSTLYPYQRQSVAKMLEREFFPRRITNYIEIEAFLGNGKKIYLDIKSLKFFQHSETFVTPRGGILAENMGLGKTCICLALISVSKLQVSQIPEEFKTDNIISVKRHDHQLLKLTDICINKINSESIIWKMYMNNLPASCITLLESNPGVFIIPEQKNPFIRKSNRLTSSSSINSVKQDLDKKLYLCTATLIVTPDNLYHQWLQEISKHMNSGFLNIFKVPSYNSPVPKPEELLKYDVVLMSNSAFGKQSELRDSSLKKIYWKRFIIDEGHSMNSKNSRSVYMAKELFVERKWAISGTPTAGLTRLHMNEELEKEDNSDNSSINGENKAKNNDYIVKRKFDAREDLSRLGLLISNFFKIDPWSSDTKLWTKTVAAPFLSRIFGSDLLLTKILSSLLVRHSLSDIENDVELPALHHKAVFLKPSFHDKISVNLFMSVLAANAVTSERVDQDYMFHPSNRSELRRLITNLQRATFYWTGFTINDIEVLVQICQAAKKKKYANGRNYYSDSDLKLLSNCIKAAKTALSNSRWRTVSAIHEMNYFISPLPTPFIRSLSIGILEESENISVYGAPQLLAAQKFFFKNRFLRDLNRLTERLEDFSKPFWTNYWKDTEKKNIQRIKNHDGQPIDAETVKEAIQEPSRWTKKKKHRREEEAKIDQEEETLVQEIVPLTSPRKRKSTTLKSNTTKKISLNNSNSSMQLLSRRDDGCINTISESIENNSCNFALSSNIRKAKILGTASSKLSYLASRLLEHQHDNIKSIVFFEFEDSAYYLTELLDIIGVNYIMYATFIKSRQRSENLSKFDTYDQGGVSLIMDLKLASHGLTIISATRVYFINPVWKRAIEAQAIKRAHRIGQTNEVYVETLILNGTIEEEMYRKRLNSKETYIDNLDIGREAQDYKGKENQVEANTLIDDSGMQEFITRHIFLNLDEENELEYSPFKCPSICKEPKIGSNDNIQEDPATLLEPVGTIDMKTKMRLWDVPLFNEGSLEKINENSSKIKNGFGIIDSETAYSDHIIIHKIEEGKEGKLAEINRQERIRYAKELRNQRLSKKKVRFI